jgi:hypothetical protein
MCINFLVLIGHDSDDDEDEEHNKLLVTSVLEFLIFLLDKIHISTHTKAPLYYTPNISLLLTTTHCNLLLKQMDEYIQDKSIILLFINTLILLITLVNDNKHILKECHCNDAIELGKRSFKKNNEVLARLSLLQSML